MIILEIKSHIPGWIFSDILMICSLKVNPLKDVRKCLRGKICLYSGESLISWKYLLFQL